MATHNLARLLSDPAALVLAHKARAELGVWPLLMNETLWAAGMLVPQSGTLCETDARSLKASLTQRGGRERWALAVVRRCLRRIVP